MLGLRHFVEEEEVAMKLFVELENGSHVATSVAVVGRRPYRDQVLLREKFRKVSALSIFSIRSL